MAEKTSKLPGWTPQPQPGENNDILFHRQLLIEIVYGLFYRKKEMLSKMSMPPQPVSLREIWLEFASRRETLVSIKEFPYPWHTKRWIDRRVNEIACPKFYNDKIPRVVAVRAGLYLPNPQLCK